jgi:hypothetical protein
MSDKSTDPRGPLQAETQPVDGKVAGTFVTIGDAAKAVLAKIKPRK